MIGNEKNVLNRKRIDSNKLMSLLGCSIFVVVLWSYFSSSLCFTPLDGMISILFCFGILVFPFVVCFLDLV
jgi:hypothetical protein